MVVEDSRVVEGDILIPQQIAEDPNVNLAVQWLWESQAVFNRIVQFLDKIQAEADDEELDRLRDNMVVCIIRCQESERRLYSRYIAPVV